MTHSELSLGALPRRREGRRQARRVAGTSTATLSRRDPQPTTLPQKRHSDEKLFRSRIFRAAPAFDRYIAPVPAGTVRTTVDLILV